MEPLPPQPALGMRSLVKVFGSTVAVADLSLDIPPGSFYGIVGPNGAGKTTTLNMATGLLVPDFGTAYVHGVDMWENPTEAKKLVGVMPDGLRLFDRLSGPDYLAYAALLRGLDPETTRQRTADLLRALGLEEAGRKLIADYSAGMTKKISLAAALVHSPKLLVLDEPFESVDPVSSQTIKAILKRFASQGGTVVLSSHVMVTVQELCDHVAVINQGRVIAAGTVTQVADGQTLEDRFAQLVGAKPSDEGLSWLGT